jgi:hypothetical protein
VNNPKRKNTQDGPVVARLLELKSIARQALAGDSNDAEYEALYDIKEALVSLTPDVRRMELALKLCVEFLQTGEIQAAIRRSERVLGQRLKKAKDGMLVWTQIQHNRRRRKYSSNRRGGDMTPKNAPQ